MIDMNSLYNVYESITDVNKPYLYVGIQAMVPVISLGIWCLALRNVKNKRMREENQLEKTLQGEE